MMLINEILERVAQNIDKKSDAAIGRALGVKNTNPSTTVKNWRERPTIPWEELCSFAIERKISINWLLTGESTAAATEHWSVKELYDRLKNDIEELKKEKHTMWEVINRQQRYIDKLSEDLRQVGIKEDITLLKLIGGNEK